MQKIGLCLILKFCNFRIKVIIMPMGYKEIHILYCIGQQRIQDSFRILIIIKDQNTVIQLQVKPTVL